MADHRTEVIRIIEGTPQPEVTVAAIARQVGISEDEVHGILEGLERDGKLTRDGDRLIVVEPAAQPAEPGEEPWY
jgi:DNA-binding IclR family transcriptional regulator